MDTRFSPAEEAFREEVRAFLRAELPSDIRTKLVDGRVLHKDDVVRWQRILNARGWAVPAWPVEWGGTGWSLAQRYIFQEEMSLAPAPEPLSYNVNMIGPVLIAFGSDEQKRRFLRPTANVDIWWCQGFSEPGAGSDLASLKTTAQRVGDEYVVNGQKVWTTTAHWADWMFCLVRTDQSVKKQAGISFLLIDMRTPGITVRPIITINGEHETNEVFLDDVRVPVENRVGEEDRGWDYAKFLLTHERVGSARVGISRERLGRVRQLAAFECVDGAPLIERRRFREKIAALEVELKALEITQLRVLSAASKSTRPAADPASSILKIKGTEIRQATTELLMEVGGPNILPFRAEGDPAPPRDPAWAETIAPTYFFWRAISIFGGSTEIQKNIVAKAVLGL